jgi:hypothetical protein
MQDGQFQVRSFRVVFQLERRIHKIDRWRLPVPHGVTLQGVAYAAGALLVVVLLTNVPLVGRALGLLAPPLRLVILPVATAYLLTRWRADGRPAHAAVVAWVRHATSPQRLSGFRSAGSPTHVVSLGEVALVPDDRYARYRRAVVVGPVRLILRYPARARARARRLRLRQAATTPMLRGRTLELDAGQRLEVDG